MINNNYRKLHGKIEITGWLECLTGLHIGASKENLEIGALDSPVVRDPISQEPYIPGSSLKGKLRALLEKAHPALLPNRRGGREIVRHECNDWEGSDATKGISNAGGMAYPGALACPVCRLFGSTGPGEGNRNFPARLKIRDLKLRNRSKLEAIDTGLLFTEWKFENGIDRVTSAANPRNLERVPRGAEFSFSIIYDVEDIETLPVDLANLRQAIRLLHDDALGGHGSRGYGQVELHIQSIEARAVAHYRGEAGHVRAVTGMDEVDQLSAFFAEQSAL